MGVGGGRMGGKWGGGARLGVLPRPLCKRGRYWPAGRRPAVTAPLIRCVPAALHAPGSPFCYGAGGDAGSGLSAACGGGECTARRPQRPPSRAPQRPRGPRPARLSPCHGVSAPPQRGAAGSQSNGTPHGGGGRAVPRSGTPHCCGDSAVSHSRASHCYGDTPLLLGYCCALF